jgi:hypothetical protein
MISFSSLLIVGAVAVAVPLLLGLVPVVKVPAVVLEILGLLSVVIYPPVALRMLKGAASRQVSPAQPREPDPS